NEAEGQTLFFFGSDPFRRSDCRPKRGAKKCLTQKKGSGTHALGANEAEGQTLFVFGSDPFRRSDCRPRRGAKKCPDPKESGRRSCLGRQRGRGSDARKRLTQEKGSGTHALDASEGGGRALALGGIRRRLPRRA